MNYHLLIDNLTNPALLFFILGIITVLVKSDLEIPPNSSKFISLYLLFAIGFKGGQELSHETFNTEIAASMLFGIAISMVIPLYTFFLLKKQINPYNAAAIAAAYGSVSAVTFVTAVSFLEIQHLQLQGHMVAIMALMESPAIIVGLLLLTLSKEVDSKELAIKKRTVLKHAFTNGSVLLILGSLCIGFMANAEQAEGIKPFTDDLFKGFLAIFLLDMGISSGTKCRSNIRCLQPLYFCHFSSKCFLYCRTSCYENICAKIQSRTLLTHGFSSNFPHKYYYWNAYILFDCGEYFLIERSNSLRSLIPQSSALKIKIPPLQIQASLD